MGFSFAQLLNPKNIPNDLQALKGLLNHASTAQPQQPVQHQLNFVTPDQAIPAAKSNADLRHESMITKNIAGFSPNIPDAQGGSIQTLKAPAPYIVPQGWSYGAVGNGINGWRDEGGVPAILPQSGVSPVGKYTRSKLIQQPQYINSNKKSALQNMLRSA